MSADNDSSELEALFDSLAGGGAPQEKAAPDPGYAEMVKKGDDAELEALFDQVASAYKAPDATPLSAAGGGDADLFFDAPPSAPVVDDLDGLLFAAPAPVVSAPAAVSPAAPASEFDGLFFENAPGLGGEAPPAAVDDDGLFISAPPVAAAPRPAPVVAPPPVAPNNSGGGDSDDLESLFDQVASNYKVPSEQTKSKPVVEVDGDDQAAFNRIGHMARELHDTLMDLGYDKMLEDTMSVLPDAKDRLSYVANLTEKAACKVLNATDIAKPVIDDIEATSRKLGARWDAVFANQVSVADFRALAEETRRFLRDGLPQKAEAANAQLLEIMMAQDFQDLTGQVIKRVVNLAQGLESGLMAALVELMPKEKLTDQAASLLNGPVISPGTQQDVVVNQEQVDDLLESLGF